MAADFDPGIDGLSRFEAIGRGGYSTVYSAWEEGFSRHVAVKILHHLDEAAERRFDRERSLMGRSSGHPNVITPIRAGRTRDGAPFLVMQYLEGGSLQDLVRRGETVAWPEAVALLRPIAEALGHSHAAGILHKDVKPANILLAANGSASLSDFGIAGVLGSTATETAFTFAHTPPEAFLGSGDESGQRDGRDERSDLYSLASTLYTIVAGRSPFAATTEEEEALPAWMYRVANHAVEPTGLDPGLDDFLIRSLAKRPDDRPQNAAEFLAGLDRLLEPDRDVATTPAPMLSASDTTSWIQPEPTRTTAEAGARPAWIAPAIAAFAVALVASLVTLQLVGSGDGSLPESSETATEQGLPVATSTGPTDPDTDTDAAPSPGEGDGADTDTDTSAPSSAEAQRAAILLQDPDNPARALLTGSLLPTAETSADGIGFTFESCGAELAELETLLGGTDGAGLRAAFNRWPSGSPRGYRDPAGEDRGFRERLGAAVEQARTGYRQCQDQADLTPVGPRVLGGWASLQAFLCMTGVAERVVLADGSSESCPADDELALCSAILAPLLDDFFAAFPDLRPDPTATCRATITDDQAALDELSGGP